MSPAAEAKALALQLRSRLAAELAPHIQHELRNPLNAISLHTDLLQRMATAADAPPPSRMTSGLDTIKKRLIDLKQRQDDLVALWLADDDDAPPHATLGSVLPAAKAVLSPLLSHQECQLPFVPLEAEAALPFALPAIELHLLLVALCTAAVAQASTSATLSWQLARRAGSGGRDQILLGLAPFLLAHAEPLLLQWLRARGIHETSPGSGVLVLELG